MNPCSSDHLRPRPGALLPVYFAMMTMGMGLSMMGALLPMLGRELGLDQISFRLYR